MNPVVKILILGVGGNVSQGILKAVRNSGIPANIVGACISPYSSGLYLCDKWMVSPYANEATFIPWLINTCNEEKIDIILTGTEENIITIAQEEKLLSERTNAIFVSSTSAQLEIGKDKYLTCKWLKENNCNYPEFCLPEDDQAVEDLVQKVGFPLLAKPRRGKSSQGITIIHNRDELSLVVDKDYVLEEYLGEAEREYTVGCYCDKNGISKTPIVLRRRLKHGSTAWAEVILPGDAYYREILEECTKICNAFHPAGPLNIQLRLDRHDSPVCFELNVRFSGTTAMRDHFGFRDVRAMIKEYVLEENIDDCFSVVGGEAYRVEHEFYLPAHTTSQFGER